MPKVKLVGPQEPKRSGLSLPQILLAGVLVLMGANYYMRVSDQPKLSPASKPGTPDDVTPRNLALIKQLKERDATVAELEAKLEEAQHSKRMTLEAQPPERTTAPRKPLAKVEGEATPMSTAVVVASGAAGGGELVDIPEDLDFPVKLRKCTKGSDLFISFSSGSMAAFALNWRARPS